MNPEGDAGAVLAGDPSTRVGDEGDGAAKDLGVKEPGVGGAVPLDVSETNGEGKGRNGGHERNGSMSGAFLAAPGYSPSFASLGDTSSFESRHVPSHSDTFEGFEPPRLSNSPEVQETPKVTRPEGLSFTTPGVANRTPEITEANTPVPGGAEKGEDHTSPIANLVEKPSADVAAPSPRTPGAALKPTFGNVDSFTFHRVPKPTGTSNEPHVTANKIPGYELLNLLKMDKPSTPLTPEASRGEDAVSPPAVEASSSAPSHSDLGPPLEAPKEPELIQMQTEPDAAQVIQPEVHEAPASEEPVVAESVVQQPEPDAAQLEQPKVDDAPVLEEPAVATSTIEKLESHTTGSPVAPVADSSSVEKAVFLSNLATDSGGKIEEVGDQNAGHGIATVDEKEVGSVQPPETIAFRNVEVEKEVPTSTATETSKSGRFGRLTSMATQKWGAVTDDDLKARVVIPKYLSKDMANAVATKGAADPEGPPAGERVEAPTCPILVFINSKSGGRLGSELMKHFEELISPNQVYDLPNPSPSAVLQYGVGCLDRMADSGDECAKMTRKNIRILVAGGDGTVGWVLSSVRALRDLSATSIPPVGIIPLGTGNDLSRSFGWGGNFSSTSKSALKKVLLKAMNSKDAPLDTWNAVVIPAKSVAAKDIQFPHAMHPQHHVSLPSSVTGEKHDKDEKDPAFEGLFFNYFSVGMDAQVAYGFHHLRDGKPWLARGRAANQVIYGSFGCTQGWFCTACSVAPRARGVANILRLSVRKSRSKDWQDIHLSSNIRAVIICNLKSYAGGRNPWGNPSSGTRQREGFEEQTCDDGLLEIMALKDGWHSAFVLLEVSTAVRLCQAEAVRLELNGKSRKKAYLQMDGEPWMQPMGRPDDEPTVVMIEKLPHPSVLLRR